jgi:hypothetical protein
MNSSTPAALINGRDLSKNTVAVRELLAYIEPPQTVVDCRYGLGGWARVVHNLFEDADLLGFEADPETFARAYKNGLAEVRNQVTAVYDQLWRPCDLLLADFNTVTQLKRRELDEELERWQPSAIIFTDVACGKLHLNYGAYGLDAPDLDAYWRRWSVERYRFERFARHHHAASTGLFTRI